VLTLEYKRFMSAVFLAMPGLVSKKFGTAIRSVQQHQDSSIWPAFFAAFFMSLF